MVQNFQKLINDEALADPNYNPEIDPKVVQLYNLMSPSTVVPEDPALVTQYTNQFLALPTANIYSAVLVNPRRCDTEEVQVLLTQLPAHFNDIRALLPSGDVAAWDAMVTSVQPEITDTTAATNEFLTHTDRLTANLPSLAGIAQGAMGLATLISNLANPCAGLSNFMGSIMAKGHDLIAGIKSKLGPLTSQLSSWVSQGLAAVGTMTSAVQSAISQVGLLKSQLRSMVQSEVSAFAGALIGQLRMGLADFMKSVHVDPCLKSIASGALTSAASSILGKIHL